MREIRLRHAGLLWRRHWVKSFAVALIPPEVRYVMSTLARAGEEGFVVGGCVRDLLLDRSPFILVTDFYASCAVLGGGTYWIVTTVLATDGIAAALCAAVTVGTRLIAVNRGWELPTAQSLGDLLQGPDGE